MNAMFTWLANIIGTLFSTWGLSLSKRAVYITAAISLSTAMTVAMSLVIKGLLSGLVYAAPGWVQAGAVILPGNTSGCISAVISAHLVRFVYDWHMANLKLASYIT